MRIFLFTILVFCCGLSCDKDPAHVNEGIDYKEKMREFVIDISQFAKANNPNFAIVPQNGVELVTQNGDEKGQPHAAYLGAIDGNGQEDLFYGYNNDNQATPNSENAYLREFLDISKGAGKTILVTDYCWTPSKMSSANSSNSEHGYLSFAADHRELNHIPDFPNPIHEENNLVIQDLAQARNFLYLINAANFQSKQAFINAVAATNYDLIIMDLFFNNGTPFTAAELAQMRPKVNGGQRLLLAYMSIGEAEDYRYYWQNAWNRNKPAWLDAENPDWAGNYKVKYWDADWQSIIYGNDDAYLNKILAAGFNGAYLDIIDAFEYFEN